MNKLSDPQKIQENRYEFPYHYIPRWDGNNFTQVLTLRRGYEYLAYINFVSDTAIRIGFESLLDVGCGDGRFLFELRQKVPGKQLMGIDYSKRAIDFARLMGHEVDWICGDIRNKNILDQNFDIVTLIDTLEHIKPEEIKDFLKGIDNNLGDNGNLIITVPSKNLPLNKKHYQHFDLNSLNTALSPYFKVVEKYYINHKASRSLKIIHKLLLNRFFILNNRKLLSRIYRYYLKSFFHSDENNCRRIVVICTKQPRF